MKKVAFIQLILIICIALSFLSCSPQDNTYAGGGIGGTGVISAGTVTEIGSVWVNGVEYDTENADIFINDELVGTGDQTVVDNLHPGHVVVVNGINTGDETGQADSVVYFSTLIGPIDEIEIIDTDVRIFYILDQVVMITGETVVMGSLNDFTIGNLVEVSGYIDEDANVQAAFIIKKSEASRPEDLLRITGIISEFDEDEKTFHINGLTVNYTAADLVGTLQSRMEDGLWVHVSGYFEGGSAELIADKVRPYNKLEDYEGLEIEIEGIISNDLIDNTFYLDGYLVEITDTTKFTGGSAEELLSGTRIEVEGTFSGDTLIAETIKFKSTFKAESELASKDEATQTLSLSGLGDLIISVNDITTKYNGIHKSFDELLEGDHLTIRGWITSENILVATMVTSTSVGNQKVSLQGSVSEIDAPYITIHTITIDTDEIPSNGFSDKNDLPVSKETFLSTVQTGETVEAKGELEDDTVSWSELILQGR